MVYIITQKLFVNDRKQPNGHKLYKLLLKQIIKNTVGIVLRPFFLSQAYSFK